MALETCFAFYYIETNMIEAIHSPYKKVEPNGRSNDGRVDRQGRFIVGGMLFGDKEQIPTYSMSYKSDTEITGHIIEGIPLVQCTNSICFSENGELMYHTDSPTGLLNVYKYNKEDSTVSDKKCFKDFNGDKKQLPDGSIVNSKNQVWTSLYFGSRVELFEGWTEASEEGKAKSLATVELPHSRITCSAIGGPDMNWMIITSALDENEETSGNVWIARVETRGFLEDRFNDVV